MIKEQLKDSEPIAYRSLLNALQNSKVAHSYLFSGEYNPLKIEAAYLLAESIIEGKNDFACETCDTCKRIRANKYFDVIFVDGYERSIRKDDVENILDEFSRTSLETSGKKVYILANINNASVKVLNMILKFMEEPSSSNTFGIFITDRKDDLLPTIVSRCQEVPFLTRDFSFLIEKYVDRGLIRPMPIFYRPSSIVSIRNSISMILSISGQRNTSSRRSRLWMKKTICPSFSTGSFILCSRRGMISESWSTCICRS